MNKNVFRLVFSQHLGMFVPASEAVIGRGGKGTSRLRSQRRALMALLAASGLHALPAMADQPAGLVPHATRPWANAAIDAARTSANQMTIRQSAAKAILNWQQFNLQRGQTLNFDQAGNKNWAALNRIFDLNPSIISGNINAPGHIYLINSNGIIFGNGAQINVGSLTAGSLDVTDSLFNSGILSGDRKLPVFAGTTGFVEVEAGAAINSATGGRVMLLAPDVTNKGVINTPQGQTILAAGEKVYLLDSTDPAGLLVEVDSGGKATNLGEIVSKLGNITMVGLAVNQEGRVSASTSVRANGSIRLQARDNTIVEEVDEKLAFRSNNTGVVKLGKNSVTEVAVEVADKEEILKSQLTDKTGKKLLAASSVDLFGAVIDIEGKVIAKGGDVRATATESANLKSRINLGKDALIDVSGLDATAPMSRNQLELQLFSAQLKDTPLLRGTDLVGKTVYVDARKGTNLIAQDELQKVIDAKGITVSEALSKAGSVKLDAVNGDVITNVGSTIDVSGGSITYAAGNIRESQLLYKGRAIDISKADKVTPYEGLADSFSRDSRKWNIKQTWTRAGQGKFNNAYTEGSNAGSVSITAQNALLRANLKALTQPAITQRESAPNGGSFSFTLTPIPGAIAPTNVEIVANNQSTLPDGFSVVGELDEDLNTFASGSNQLAGNVYLDTQLFANGFNQLNVNAAANNIIVSAPISTTPKGSVNLNSGNTTVNANITVPSGNITIAGDLVTVANNIKLSASGTYTNDNPSLGGSLNSPLALNGGSVTVKSTNLVNGGLALGQGVELEVNAGAWVNALGTPTTGDAGAVSITGLKTLEGLSVSAFGFSKGGSLTLEAPNDLQIGGVNPFNANTLWVPESLLSQGGFSQYTFATTVPESSHVLVGDNQDSRTFISPQARLFELNSDYRARSGGSKMTEIAQQIKPLVAQAGSITIDSKGSLTVAENATIFTGTPAKGNAGAITLKSTEQMNILGDLIAPAGTIKASVDGTVGGNFDGNLSLFVGENALLSAKGEYVVLPSATSVLNAKVLDAGSISLKGNKDAAVITKEGSIMDVSGAFGQVDVKLPNRTERQTHFGAAGAIEVSARNGVLLDGDMRASAVGTGFDGSLSFALSGQSESEGGYPESRAIVLTQNKQNLSNNINPGESAVITPGEVVLTVSAKQIQDAGFGTLNLSADDIVNDKVVIADNVNLKLQDAITIKSNALEIANGAKASLAADYVAFTSDFATPTATAGTGEMNVNAKWIDLAGNIAVSGVEKTNLTADLDIRARGAVSGVLGSLDTTGDVNLKSRQIYPATNSQFKIETTGEARTIKVESNGATPKLPLSAGGALTLKADNIIQSGAVRAPFGTIKLDAKDKLTLASGSLTSTSAEGQLIPYGSTTLGGLAIFKPSEQLFSNQTQGTTEYVAQKVDLQGRIVETNTGAKVDISGGGDTFAYEWIAGIGGSTDKLGQSGVYAILPSLKGEFAPYDPNFNLVRTATNSAGVARTDIKPGESIYISGVKGLADGQYTLLPARYALMPGAYTVEISTKTLDTQTSIAQLEGSTLVSGYRINGANRSTENAVFSVASADVFRPAKGAVSRAPAEYKISNGSQFFGSLASANGASSPRLTKDAGQLVINAGEKLVLDLTVKADKADQARGSIVDISSENIQVVSAIDAGVTDALQLTTDSLNNLNAESLLLGGVRTTTADGFSVDTKANKVTFANDASKPLKPSELIATAKDTITVSSGASIETLATSAPTSNVQVNTTGDGALLAVSSLNDIDYSRSDAAKTAGTLQIAAGANVRASRSMVLDASFESDLKGNATVGDSGSLTFGANRIVLGDADDAVTGLRVSDSLVDSFGKLAKVSLNSNSNIDIYGPVSLGNENLDLTFNTGGIAGHTAGNETATLTARNFTLKNSAGAAFETNVAAQDSVLNVQATNILIAGENKSSTNIAGFEQVNLNAKQEVKFSGAGATDITALQTNIKSGRITAATGTDYALRTTGNLATSKSDVNAVLANVTGLGAKLNLSGANVALGGNIELPSGLLTAQATTGNLTVSSDANVKVGSAAVQFDRFTEYTPGGKVVLQSDNGNVQINSGATVDVSGGVGGNAGTVAINATKGAVSVAANTLKGQALTGNQTGRFALDAATVTDFSTLNNTLNAGGFTASRDMRIRTGDVSIAAGDTIQAQEFNLSADGGKIEVAGTIDASGQNGGKIAINARDALTLKNTAKLLARGTGDNLIEGDKRTGAGGSVQLGSLSTATTSAVSAEAGALIDVSGDEQGAVKGAKGDVTMRAYRGTTANTNTVNVAFDTTAAVKGADAVRIDAVRVYESSTFNSNTLTIVADTNAFYNANPNAGSYAATQDGATVQVLPEIELRSTNTNTPTDLTVSADVNMRALGTLQAGKGGKLTLRANKDIKMNGSLSDGFNSALTTGALQEGNTFSFDLIAGADFSAANVMETIKGVGNLDLASGKLIRTGQGDIRIATGGNVTLGNSSSVIYTVGQKAPDLADFNAPVNPTPTTPANTLITSASYLTNGGDITIDAQGNVTGALGTGNSQQLANNWLFRQGAGSGNRDLTWWVRPDLFRAGIATFGGGDVNVNAGGNITNLSAAAPTTARYDSFNGTNPGTGAFRVDGGGDVTITAGGDIVNGVYHAGRGDVALDAGGAIRKTNGAFGTTISLQDANVNVSALNDVLIESIHNPTLLHQASVNASGNLTTSGVSPYFVSYGETNTVKLQSLTGDAGIGAGTNIATGTRVSGFNGSLNPTALEFMPSNVAVTAYGGDINLEGLQLTLSPASKGNLSLLASENINLSSIGLSDADASLLANVNTPANNSTQVNANLTQFRVSHAANLLHKDDLVPVSIVAKNGSITTTPSGTITAPKAAYISAGKDVTVSADIQHVNNGDITVIRAGRDITMPEGTTAQIKLGGKGDLLVEAGRDVLLGSSLGIVTVANTQNPNLPFEGASISVLAGLGKEGADLNGYVNRYINPTGAGPSELSGDAEKLATYRGDTAKAVGAYMRGLNGKDEKEYSNADAMTQYLALDKDKQSVFAYRHVSSELLASAKNSTDSSKQQRGDAAIATLFPNNRTYKGDLALFNSQLRTLRNGSIDILTPGGFINAGVPTSAGENIGIITEFGGDIRAFAETGFQVEQSKVITQYGSNITVWANNGDIDAGRGSKTALSTPSRVISTDADGNTTIEVKGSAAGSGIRAQTYDLDGPTGALTAPRLGDVALIAPRGVLNAGEAGIGAGNFIGVATVVLGANNITVAGSSSGIPVADTGSLAGSLAGTTNAVADSTKSIASDIGRQASQNAVKPSENLIPSIISVDVISIGN
jgi:filamentous hemagglutinin